MLQPIRLLSIVLLLLTGCRGMYDGQERTVGEFTDDTYITTVINAKLVRDKELSALDINVDSHRGVVSLYGNVRSADAERRAVDLARSVKGVTDVKSRLVVIPDKAAK